jgi:WLM domain
MKQVFIILLLITIAFILFTNQEDPLLTELKNRYEILLKSDLPDEFKILKTNRAIVTAKSVEESDQNIAYNVNKGYEIHICLDGKNINGAMYVFLHELAHITVEEYDHSERYWANFKRLREYAAGLGIYTPEKELEYCGQKINDSLKTSEQSKK